MYSQTDLFNPLNLKTSLLALNSFCTNMLNDRISNMSSTLSSSIEIQENNELTSTDHVTQFGVERVNFPRDSTKT